MTLVVMFAHDDLLASNLKRKLSTRVWTQLAHNLMANICTIARKFALSFSYLVVNLLMSFIVQKNRSTMLRMRYRALSCGIGFLAFDLVGMTTSEPWSAMRCRIEPEL